MPAATGRCEGKAVAGIDLKGWRIEQVVIKDTKPASEIPETTWQNFLVLSNLNLRVRTVCSVASMEGRFGLDPASLKLKWLKAGRLLLVSWTTLSQGSGYYTYDGNVILQMDGHQGKEVFRDYFQSAAKAGWAAQSWNWLKIDYDEAASIFTFTRTNEEVNGDNGLPPSPNTFPLTETFVIDGETQTNWISDVTTINTWHYKWTGSRLKFLDGHSALDFTKEPVSIDAIANDFKISRARLEAMNPNLRSQKEVNGVVLISKSIKPYKMSTYDAFK